MPGLDLSRVSFLVVDDSDHMRRLIRLVLGSFGAKKVKEARDGADALQEMMKTMPDILITNWQMMPMDGLELTKHLRKSSDSPNPFLPIIMVTAHSERGRVLEARDAGVTEFLVKPMSAKALYSRIAAVIERPRRFVRTKLYFGPDRRRRDDALYRGNERRGVEKGKTPPVPRDQPMNQAEINALFNPDD